MTAEGKKNLKKRLFILSFLPYGAIVLIGLYFAIFGFSFMFNTTYGLDAFIVGAAITAAVLTIVPVLPAALVFHLICLTKRIAEKAGASPEKARKAAKIAGIATGIAVAVPVIIFIKNLFFY